jgi:hypothetical protein
MSDLSEKILKLTTYYIGPASARFLERQTVSHMNGLKFADINKTHIQELAKWVNISAGLLVDKTKAEELSKKILAQA